MPEESPEEKKLPTCKPDPVPAVRQAVIIYLVATLLQQSSCLPSGIGRAALKRRYMWHFSMQGLPAPSVTWRGRGLLPRVFNLTPPFGCTCAKQKGRGSYFLWHYLLTPKRPPVLSRCIALCCPDFPPPICTESDDPVGSVVKIGRKGLSGKGIGIKAI
jgi:hypothetical protein